MLLCITRISIIPTCIATSSWTCILDSVTVENITLNDVANNEQSGPLFVRHLRSSNSAGGKNNNDAVTVLPQGYYARRRYRLDENNNNNNNNNNVTDIKSEVEEHDDAPPIITYQEGRECTCATDTSNIAHALPPSEVYYCPLPMDRCTVRSRRWSSSSVECYEYKNWKIGYARSIWFWLCFAWLLLLLYPIFSRPGQHAVRYLLSKCFPQMNPWIAEQLLQTEIEARNHISDEFENFARLKRRTEGWITGYRIKTKVYSTGDDRVGQNDERDSKSCLDNNDDSADNTIDREVSNDGEKEDCKMKVFSGGDNEIAQNENHCSAKNYVECDAIMNGDDKLCRDDGDSSAEREASQNEENEDCVCTICILPLEDGDRVADLSCGHTYHVDCLSEWIVKKNSCPLCQGPVAIEIRSFETDSSTTVANNDSPRRKGILSRCRNHVTDSLTDIATGRDRRIHRAHRARIRSMLDESRDASLENVFGEESGAWSADRSFFRRRWNENE